MVSCRLGCLLCCKHDGSRIKLSLWPFCGLILAHTVTFGQVLKAKSFNRCFISLIGLGGPTLRIGGLFR